MENANSQEEINVSDLIDKARKQVNKKEISEGEYNLNLVLLSPNLDNITRINTLTIKSFIYYNKKNENMILHFVKKMYSYLDKTPKLNDTDLGFCIVRTIYRGGIYFENEKKFYDYIAAMFIYRAKCLFEEVGIRNESESYNNLENHFTNVLKNITDDLSDRNARFVNKSFEIEKIKLALQLVMNKDFDDYILISCTWLNNLKDFLNRTNHKDTFNKSKVLLLYFSNGGDSNTAEENSRKGSYPGPINNFFISNFKDFWFDPDEKEFYTNQYLMNNITEQTNYSIVPKKVFDIFNNYFDTCFPIYRKAVMINDELIVEVHLKKMKILVLSRTLLKYGKELINTRYIQLSKNATFVDLKNKLVRCFLYLLKEKQENGENIEDINNLKINIFKTSDISKKQLFELIFSYTNGSLVHKIEGEELVEPDSTKIGDLKIASKDIIVIEITNKNSSESNFIELVKEHHEKYCSCCGVTIDISSNSMTNKVVYCPKCTNSLYCSKICLENDKAHIQYHNNIAKLYKKKINLNDIINIDINDILGKNCRRGITGLKNLGNTCFMNSAVQCLSHCQELTKYFLLGNYLEEINKFNKHGSSKFIFYNIGGQIAKAYGELVKELWGGQISSLSPWDFRQIFVTFIKQFAGFSQHDSHEMLVFMLDALHEDLNRVKEKPYLEMKEKDTNENNSDASKRWWNNHLIRENSIIVDLFHGQYRSEITCPECNRISITFDPFMYLGLPIPNESCRLKFKFFPYDYNFNYEEFEIGVSESTYVVDLKKIVSDKKNLDIDSLDAILVNKEKVFITTLKAGILVQHLYENKNEVLIYERKSIKTKNKENTSNSPFVFYITPTEFIEEKSMLIFTNKIHYPRSYTKPFYFELKNTVKNLYIDVFKFFRKLFEDVEGHLYEDFIKMINNAEFIEKEFEFYRKYLKLHFVNNIPESESWFNSKENCEFCREKCKMCKFCYDDDMNLSKIYLTLRTDRKIHIYAEIIPLTKKKKSSKDSSKNLYNDMSNSLNSLLTKKKGEVSIYDCIEMFSKEEKLEKDNAWYCSKCGKHQEATKKLEIYKPPYILIIQFKRFKIRSTGTVMGFLSNKKNDCFVDYPINNLDLSNYVADNKKGEEYKYDLFAISQHYGGLSSGHYTALARNEDNWFNFDDDRTSKADKADVVSSSAYLLFYKRKIMK